MEAVCSPTRSPPRGSKQPVVLGSCSPVPASKYWLNRKRKVSPGVLFAAVLVAFAAQAAGAQTAPLPQPTLQQLGAPSAPAGYCKQSTLTGPVFLNLLSTIIKHGDLTDIAFLQKTLGTKFSMNYGPGLGGNPDHQEPEYDSDQVLDSPIHVHVVVHLDVIEGKPSLFGNAIAWIRFEGTSMASWGYIHDCMELPVDELESRYGADGFIQRYPTGGGSIAGETTQAEFPGKNNTKLAIGWMYGSGGRIKMVGISQLK